MLKAFFVLCYYTKASGSKVRQMLKICEKKTNFGTRKQKRSNSKSTFHVGYQNYSLIVPTPLVGEGTIYSNGFFFLFSEFWPIDIFVVEKCEWYH